MNASDPTGSEFGTVAAWTADAARALGPRHYIPAGCRGSGGPSALDWFLDRLAGDARPGLLDVGAGVGGPAGYARERNGLPALLVEPERAACRAARSLFDLPTICADAAALPLPSSSFEVAWSLGVLCTTPDQAALLHELHRVLRADARAGLLVYTATRPLDKQPAGNHFPTRDRLLRLCEASGFAVTDRTTLDELPSSPPDWQHRQDAVRELVAERHAGHEAWRESVRQEKAIADLLSSGAVAGQLLLLAPARVRAGRVRPADR